SSWRGAATSPTPRSGGGPARVRCTRGRASLARTDWVGGGSKEGEGMGKLTVDDIRDLRACERGRGGVRRRVVALKKSRRIALGDLVTIVFENTDTMRFQIQEMARAEKMLRDEQIEHEVATYNELIPDAGELSATLFIEITDPERLREWLPKLPGIQR